jgi:hypothetical protein
MIHAGKKIGRERRGCSSLVRYLVVLVAVLWPGLCPAQILNPSFETTFTAPGPRLVPLHWGRVDNTSFNSDCGNGWSTDGALSARLYSRTGRTFAPGAYQSFWQLVDLTEVGAIAFDVRLVASPSGVFEHFEASFWVGGVPLWNCTDGGVYENQIVDVSQVTGWRIIELRMTALASGPFSISYWAQWDNLRVLAVLAATDPGPIEAFVALEPNTLNLASQGKWVTCYIALEEGYDVTEIDGSTVALEDIPAHRGREGWARPEANEENIVDLDGNGFLVRMVKFDRAAVQDIVPPPEAEVRVTGQLLDGTWFEGFTVIRVIDKGGKKK